MPDSFTLPPEMANGDWVTPAWLNTYLRANMNTLWPFTTAGDLPYALSASQLGRLGIGSAGQMLGVSGGLPAWMTPDVIHAYGSVNNVGTVQSTSSPSYQNVSGASISLTLTKTCFVAVWGNATGVVGSGAGSYSMEFNLLIDGTSVGPFLTFTPYPGAVGIGGYKVSVAAGTRTIQLRFSSPFSISVSSYGAFLNAIAIPM